MSNREKPCLGMNEQHPIAAATPFVTSHRMLGGRLDGMLGGLDGWWDGMDGWFGDGWWMGSLLKVWVVGWDVGWTGGWDGRVVWGCVAVGAG